MLTEKQQQFIHDNQELETPYLLVDLDLVSQHYQLLTEALPFAACYYAVKCNPAGPLLKHLCQLGSRFEVASIYEMDACLAQGVPIGDIHYGNTIKRSEDIRLAYEKGVHSFTVDSDSELLKLARNAPQTKVSFRLETDGKGAVFGLDKKFGARKDDIIAMMLHAAELELVPFGVSFHVGSQQMDPDAWLRALDQVGEIFAQVADHGVEPRLVNLGGGWPAKYTPSLDAEAKEIDIFDYASRIKDKVGELFDPHTHFVIEPGRFISADAGVIRTRVVLVTHRGDVQRRLRWVFTDVGRFNGLHDAGIVKYPIKTNKDHHDTEHTVLAGPTCDSDDVLYTERNRLHLPKGLEEGDDMLIFGTGAYTSSFSTVNFNGFPALKEYYI